jgi:hypothetical protein
MSTDAYSLPPQPAPDPDSEQFWEATTRGELALCRCVECRTWIQPPLERCRHCAGETRFESVSGGGTIYSFIVVRHPCCPGYLDDLPGLVGLIELDEQAGLRLTARLVDAEPGQLAIGQRVQAEIVDLPGGEFRVPVFRVVDSAG